MIYSHFHHINKYMIVTFEFGFKKKERQRDRERERERDLCI